MTLKNDDQPDPGSTTMFRSVRSTHGPTQGRPRSVTQPDISTSLSRLHVVTISHLRVTDIVHIILKITKSSHGMNICVRVNQNSPDHFVANGIVYLLPGFTIFVAEIVCNMQCTILTELQDLGVHNASRNWKLLETASPTTGNVVQVRRKLMALVISTFALGHAHSLGHCAHPLALACNPNVLVS